MTRDELKNFNLLYLKGYAEVTLGSDEVGGENPSELTSMIQTDKKYTCPYCGSGNGERRTPAFTVYSEHFHCYSCGKHGDIFDLIAKVEKIPPNTRRVFKRAEELFKDGNNDGLAALKKWRGETAGNSPIVSAAPESILRADGTPMPKADYSAYIAGCHAAVNQTDYWAKRGISERNIERFRLGYDPKFNSVVIPYGADNSYYIQRKVEGKGYYKRHAKEAGPEPIFNVGVVERGSYEGKFKTIFVCEGQIDAISFYEVRQEAIALGSTTNINKLVRYLEKDMPYRYLHLLVLALDNDDIGRKAERELSRALDKLPVRHYTSNVLGGYKDANEALLKEPGEFWFRAARIAKAVVRNKYQFKVTYLVE